MNELVFNTFVDALIATLRSRVGAWVRARAFGSCSPGICLHASRAARRRARGRVPPQNGRALRDERRVPEVREAERGGERVARIGRRRRADARAGPLGAAGEGDGEANTSTREAARPPRRRSGLRAAAPSRRAPVRSAPPGRGMGRRTRPRGKAACPPRRRSGPRAAAPGENSTRPSRTSPSTPEAAAAAAPRRGVSLRAASLAVAAAAASASDTRATPPGSASDPDSGESTRCASDASSSSSPSSSSSSSSEAFAPSRAAPPRSPRSRNRARHPTNDRASRGFRAPSWRRNRSSSSSGPSSSASDAFSYAPAFSRVIFPASPRPAYWYRAGASLRPAATPRSAPRALAPAAEADRTKLAYASAPRSRAYSAHARVARAARAAPAAALADPARIAAATSSSRASFARRKSPLRVLQRRRRRRVADGGAGKPPKGPRRRRRWLRFVAVERVRASLANVPRAQNSAARAFVSVSGRRPVVAPARLRRDDGGHRREALPREYLEPLRVPGDVEQRAGTPRRRLREHPVPVQPEPPGLDRGLGEVVRVPRSRPRVPRVRAERGAHERPKRATDGVVVESPRRAHLPRERRPELSRRARRHRVEVLGEVHERPRVEVEVEHLLRRKRLERLRVAVREPDEERHRRGEDVEESVRKERDEHVLPPRRRERRGGGANRRGQRPGVRAAEDDAALVEERREERERGVRGDALEEQRREASRRRRRAVGGGAGRGERPNARERRALAVPRDGDLERLPGGRGRSGARAAEEGGDMGSVVRGVGGRRGAAGIIPRGGVRGGGGDAIVDARQDLEEDIVPRVLREDARDERVPRADAGGQEAAAKAQRARAVALGEAERELLRPEALRWEDRRAVARDELGEAEMLGRRDRDEPRVRVRADAAVRRVRVAQREARLGAAVRARGHADDEETPRHGGDAGRRHRGVRGPSEGASKNARRDASSSTIAANAE